MKSIFTSLYARYYDTMYGEKKYARETAYLETLIRRHIPSRLKRKLSILTFGAGTLGHEIEFAKRGHEVLGVEFSREMVGRAEAKIARLKVNGVAICHGDMRSFSTDRCFDAVVIPFNVVSYCKGVADLSATLRSASAALAPGGVLVFDCWDLAAVKKDPPRQTWATYVIPGGTLYKLVDASPVNRKGSFTRTIHLIEVVRGKAAVHKEEHVLFAWDVNVVRKLSARANLSLEAAYEWMTTQPARKQKWAIALIATKGGAARAAHQSSL